MNEQYENQVKELSKEEMENVQGGIALLGNIGVAPQRQLGSVGFDVHVTSPGVQFGDVTGLGE